VGLLSARRRRGLTQQQLATRAGLTQSTIAMLERLRHPNPKWDTVAALSRALRVSPFKLFGSSSRETTV
jgi:transcriptional regulator with XRE-family HTH domain